MPLEIQMKEFSKPRPLEAEGDLLDDNEPLDQQIIDCVVTLTNPNQSESITDITVNFDVATPIIINPSSVAFPSIGKY